MIWSLHPFTRKLWFQKEGIVSRCPPWTHAFHFISQLWEGKLGMVLHVISGSVCPAYAKPPRSCIFLVSQLTPHTFRDAVGKVLSSASYKSIQEKGWVLITYLWLSLKAFAEVLYTMYLYLIPGLGNEVSLYHPYLVHLYIDSLISLRTNPYSCIVYMSNENGQTQY